MNEIPPPATPPLHDVSALDTIDIGGRNLYLVGLMGAGKTTVGRQLARRMGRRFVDSDHEIEARTGVRIPSIFEIEGEAGFRQRETQVIADLATTSGQIGRAHV